MLPDHHLAAILFTDIEGYTAMMQKDEAVALSAVRRHNLALQASAKIHNGEIVNFYGDGCLAVFPSAIEALQCAVDVQKELWKAPPIPVRMGLHIGEIMFEDGKAIGDGINVASRIQSLGIGNSILFSSDFHNNIKNQPEFRTVSLGSFHFKNVENPMDVFALSNEGLAVPKKHGIEGKLQESHKPGSLKTIYIVSAFILLLMTIFLVFNKSSRKAPLENSDKSIAVLPFENMSSDPEQEYFADGMTEEITARLSSIKGLRVTSRTSVMPYKGKIKALNIREIALQLNVTNVLEGSVRKSGDKLRITVQLIDARTDQHVWAEVYDRDLVDVFKIHSEIASSIADKFMISISPEAKKKIDTIPTSNMKAYDLYLKARSTSYQSGIGWGLGSASVGRKKEIAYLKESITLDPDFIQPYALLSKYYWGEKCDSAALLAKEAIIRNPASSEGYIALAFASIEPTIYTGSTFYISCANAPSSEESLEWLHKAYELDTLKGLLAFAEYYKNKAEFPMAIKCYTRVAVLEPHSLEANLGKAWIYSYMEQVDSMNKYISNAYRASSNAREIQELLLTHAKFGGLIAEAMENSKKFYADDTIYYNYNVALTYLMARNWTHALNYYLKSNYKDMDLGLVLLKTGRRDSGRLVLKKALAYKIRLGSGWDLDLSRIHAVLGNKAAAIGYFRKAVDHGWHMIGWMRNDPYWDELRNDPEFKKITDEMERRNADMLLQIRKDEKKKFSLDF